MKKFFLHTIFVFCLFPIYASADNEGNDENVNGEQSLTSEQREKGEKAFLDTASNHHSFPGARTAPGSVSIFGSDAKFHFFLMKVQQNVENVMEYTNSKF